MLGFYGNVITILGLVKEKYYSSFLEMTVFLTSERFCLEYINDQSNGTKISTEIRETSGIEIKTT